MDEHDWLAERFEANRTHLRSVAYRMLGSRSDVDDAVQEAWLRLSRSDTSGVENLGGWLTTVVARVCMDMLRSRRSRREEPLGAHLLDPIISREDGTDPEHEALLADSVGPALLVVLETLAPAERLAFVLHDMFAVPHEEIAPIVGRSPVAARQLASRARRRVQGADRAAEHAGAAAEVRGAPAVAETFSGRARFAQAALVDGAVGAVWAPGGQPRVVFGFTMTRGKIVEIDLVADPERLRQLDLAVSTTDADLPSSRAGAPPLAGRATRRQTAYP